MCSVNRCSEEMTTRDGNGTKTAQHKTMESKTEAEEIQTDMGGKNFLQVALMTASMTILSADYELLRSASMALATSSSSEHSINVSLLMSISAPFSLLLFTWFTYEISRGSPRTCFARTTNGIAFFFLFSGAFLRSGDGNGMIIYENADRTVTLTANQVCISCIYLICENFYGLICTQQWSFISDVVTPDQGKLFFAPIGGCASLSGAIAGALVKPLLAYLPLPTLLSVGGAALLIVAFVGEYAYGIGDRGEGNDSSRPNRGCSIRKAASDPSSKISIGQAVYQIFKNEPVLVALGIEVFAAQVFSTILSICYMTNLKGSLPLETERAIWTGRFYSFVNLCSGTLQFAALPLLMNRVDQRTIWLTIPIIMLSSVLADSTISNSSLLVHSVLFGMMKICDYSVRGVATELVFVSMDSESRSAGKQFISTFVSKSARTLTSMVLASLMSASNVGSLSAYLSIMKITTGCLWLIASFHLTKLLKLTQIEAIKKK